MKLLLNLSAAAALMLGSCVAPGPQLLKTEGPLSRQVVRVVARHDSYVKADVSLSDVQRDAYLEESRDASDMVVYAPEVSADVLAAKLGPVLDRHDSYVKADLKLELLMSETYLASSAGLRALLKAARGSGY